jgi:hypothetical protein
LGLNFKIFQNFWDENYGKIAIFWIFTIAGDSCIPGPKNQIFRKQLT